MQCKLCDNRLFYAIWSKKKKNAGCRDEPGSPLSSNFVEIGIWSVPRVTTTGQMQSRVSVIENDWIATGLKFRILRQATGGARGSAQKSPGAQREVT